MQNIIPDLRDVVGPWGLYFFIFLHISSFGFVKTIELLKSPSQDVTSKYSRARFSGEFISFILHLIHPV